MNYINELYSGNLNPSSQRFTNDSMYGKLMRQQFEIYTELSQTLSDDNNKELLNKISELQVQISDLTASDNYAAGFRDGSRLMIDILLGRNKNLINI